MTDDGRPMAEVPAVDTQDTHWLTELATTRLIIDSDAACEADDQFAIVHALLTPTVDLRGIVPNHFGTAASDRSMELSRAEVERLLRLTGLTGRIPVADGAAHALTAPDEPVDSPGARLIVEEAHAGRGRLYVAVLGPLTTVASAVLLDPSIVEEDVVVVWIGGPPYDDVHPLWPACFNLANDRVAANVVFGSGLEVWQVPMDVYSSITVGYAELWEKVRPHGELGRYLVDQLVAFNRNHHRGPIDGRILGDSPAIGVVLNEQVARWRMRTPMRFTDDHRALPSEHGRPVRSALSIDSRYILGDLFAKIRFFPEGVWPTASRR